MSSTLEQPDWNALLLRGDLGEAVRQLSRSGATDCTSRLRLSLALAELRRDHSSAPG
ncbi:hypothetical protein [Jiangella alkaliphila]|uniref:hypothetical protein n=1 Tax=Jiangella alkaliphila TaxID=419479 RepID=UPI0018D3890B|nr:hypothetical protein [Jiangella alkaliphila]